jgi:hypothetical protein
MFIYIKPKYEWRCEDKNQFILNVYIFYRDSKITRNIKKSPPVIHYNETIQIFFERDWGKSRNHHESRHTENRSVDIHSLVYTPICQSP